MSVCALVTDIVPCRTRIKIKSIRTTGQVMRSGSGGDGSVVSVSVGILT